MNTLLPPSLHRSAFPPSYRSALLIFPFTFLPYLGAQEREAQQHWMEGGDRTTQHRSNQSSEMAALAITFHPGLLCLQICLELFCLHLSLIAAEAGEKNRFLSGVIAVILIWTAVRHLVIPNIQ